MSHELAKTTFAINMLIVEIKGYTSKMKYMYEEKRVREIGFYKGI